MNGQLNLLHNYHELDRWQRLQYWMLQRGQLSPEDRFFFEGHRGLPGQMYREERRALYGAVMARKPRLCFEIGTASGGGSTFFIASAFKALGAGKLISLESSKGMHDEAKRRYSADLKHLRPHVELLHGSSPNAFLSEIRESGSAVECLFLDGSNNAEEAVAQYQIFRQFVGPDTILMAHDWNDVKMSLLRPIVEEDRSWRLLKALEAPVSVGFVVYKFDGSDR
jgi:predicted O-methyltransferase YrrM